MVTFIRSNSQPIVVPIKPMALNKPAKQVVEFRVRNVEGPKEVWKPSNSQSSLVYNEMGEGEMHVIVSKS